MPTQELCDQEIDLYRMLLEGTTELIFLFDKDKRVIKATPIALRTMGRITKDVVGKHLNELEIDESARKEYERVLDEVLIKGKHVVGESSYLAPEGMTFYSFEASPIANENDRPEHVVVTVKNITRQRGAEQLNESLNRINAAINSTLNFDDIMKRVIVEASNSLRSTAAAVSMHEGDRWVLRYTHGAIPEEAIGATMTEEQMRSCFLATEDCSSGKIDVRKTDWISKEMMERFHIISFISVPLRTRGELIGVLVFAYSEQRRFSPGELDFAQKLSLAVSLALENSSLYRQERRERFLMQTIIDNVPAVVIAMDGMELKIKWANKASDAFKMGPFKDISTVGLRLQDIIPNAEETGLAEMFRGIAKSGRPFFDNEFTLGGLGPDIIYWRGALVPLEVPDQDVPDILILAVDVTKLVTARKTSEEMAQRAEQEQRRLKTILGNLPVGVLIADRSGKIVENNEIAGSIWEAIGLSPKNIWDLEAVHAWYANNGIPMKLDDWGIVRAIFWGEVTSSSLITMKRYDGREMTLLMSAAPLTDDEGRTVGGVSIMQDVTLQLRLEKEVLEAKSRAELYVDLLTHDINNLNTAAMGYLQLLEGLQVLGKKELGWTERALESLQESSRLIENIRSIQQIEAGETKETLIDIEEMLKKVIIDLQEHPSREIKMELSSKGHHCVMASDLLREVFLNLIDNAIKHSSGPLDINIRLSSLFEMGRELHRLDIEDNGPGITDELKERIFSRAERGRTKAVGKGLGLFLVKRLVEDFRGRVWVEDRVKGDHTKGAKFTVLLPAAPCVQGDRSGDRS